MVLGHTRDVFLLILSTVVLKNEIGPGRWENGEERGTDFFKGECSITLMRVKPSSYWEQSHDRFAFLVRYIIRVPGDYTEPVFVMKVGWDAGHCDR